VADVEVNPADGQVRVTRVVVAHDCGLIINPDGLRNQIEGNVIQAISRTLKEEVKFDRANAFFNATGAPAHSVVHPVAGESRLSLNCVTILLPRTMSANRL